MTGIFSGGTGGRNTSPIRPVFGLCRSRETLFTGSRIRCGARPGETRALQQVTDKILPQGPPASVAALHFRRLSGPKTGKFDGRLAAGVFGAYIPRDESCMANFVRAQRRAANFHLNFGPDCARPRRQWSKTVIGQGEVIVNIDAAPIEGLGGRPAAIPSCLRPMPIGGIAA